MKQLELSKLLLILNKVPKKSLLYESLKRHPIGTVISYFPFHAHPYPSQIPQSNEPSFNACYYRED